jgi:urea transport system substrate-binding protein
MLSRWRLLLGFLATVVAFAAAPAQAERRLALVVGIDNYQSIDRLNKAVNDARAVGAALREIGFDVAVAENVDRRRMSSSLVELENKISPGDTVFFYYAGHGFEITGRNYLLMADLPKPLQGQESLIKDEAFAADQIIDRIQARGARSTIMVLDACRDNPFAEAGGRGLAGSRGLARMTLGNGVFVVFSAGAKQIALDRLNANDRNPNSVFTRVFLTELRTPGLTLDQMVRRTRQSVNNLTNTVGQTQTPAYYDQMIEDVVLRPAAPGAPAPVVATPAPTPAPATTPAPAPAQTPAPSVAVVVPPPAPPPPRPTAPKPAVGIFAPPEPGSIKVGILHSLSGTMATSEAPLKDALLFLIDEQNKRGGVLGKRLDPVVVDPASNWPLFAEKARDLITKDKVSVVFGTYASVSRKSVLPVFKELNSLLFYPVQFEGEESERNIFYTGAAPNQQAIPAADYLMSEEKAQRFVLVGTDFVYPRTINKILENYLASKGVKPGDIMINYTPFGFSDWQKIVADIKRFASAGRKTAVISSINGDANIPFYRELAAQGIKTNTVPVLALSIGEGELAGIDPKPLAGQLAAWNYFQSIDTPSNREFIARWRAFMKNPKRVTSDPMEAHAIGFAMWVAAVQKAGTTDPDKVIDAIVGVKVANLTGGTAEMMPDHHITRQAFVGEIRTDGQFDAVWKSSNMIPAEAWSKQLPGSKDLIADWATLKCGNYNTVTKRCGG